MVSVAPDVRGEAVTSDEIRKIGSRTDSESKFVGLFLREIAAQLAEQNQQIRDDRLQRKVWRDEDQIFDLRRARLCAASGRHGFADSARRAGRRSRAKINRRTWIRCRSSNRFCGFRLRSQLHP